MVIEPTGPDAGVNKYMFKEKLNNIYRYYLKGKTLKLVGILAIVLSLPIAIALLRQRVTYRTQAVVEPVDISFPPCVTIPTDNCEFARFNLTSISTTANDSTQLQFTTGDVQVVDTTAEVAPSYNFTNSSLTLNT